MPTTRRLRRCSWQGVYLYSQTISLPNGHWLSVIGLSEPALVLTPPETATALDDGVLTASEIARLKAENARLSKQAGVDADDLPGLIG